ncbi:hypothetical protein DSM104443_03953 [Usitatibacter rugosus]|uniref:RDD domain-containing protein n=1 Tax=Usitatibacter rugosus TaxID=2732067 RepID=A0A6M4H031_9PROT|nr:RDD family protein [Usitatibacter rugosus]QJR12859.1 hypothetical protein DSM104443_03953 [Usitatibacter rugosus]
MIDTLRPVSLPEGAEITLRLAGPVARARAWSIDFGIRAMAMMSLPPLLQHFGDAGLGVMTILWFAISTLYPVFFEALWNGATPGKRVCHLAVVHADGTPVGWSAALLRNIVRIADTFPVGYAVGFTVMLFDPQFRRLGDLAAGTVVIHRDSLAARATSAPEVPGLASPVALSALEQRAVLDFGERRGTWSHERAAELAETAGPLVGNLHGDAAADRISAIAAFLRGRR